MNIEKIHNRPRTDPIYQVARPSAHDEGSE